MGERRQVAGRPQRPVLGDVRTDAGVQKRDHGLDQLRPNARETGGQRPGPEQHHSAHDLAVDGRPHPGAVAEDDGPLQHRPVIDGDGRIGEGTEPRGHSIYGGVGVVKALDDRERWLHSLASSLGHLDLLPPARHVDDLGDRERRAVDAHQPTLRGEARGRQAPIGTGQAPRARGERVERAERVEASSAAEGVGKEFLIRTRYDGNVAVARVWARMTDRRDCIDCIYICADS